MATKILILVNHDLVLYNFRRELIKELIDSNYEVFISSPNGEKINFFIEMGCIFIDTKINRHGKNFFEDIKLYFFYKKIIKEIKPYSVLTFTIKPNIYGGFASKKMKIPYIANITGLGKAVEKTSLLQLLTTYLYKLSFEKVNTVFFQNKENMKFFKSRGISSNKHVLLPGSGVNLEYFNYLKYPNPETIHFSFISRIMKDKGIDLYLEMARIFTEKYNNVVFHVCGFCEENYLPLLNDLHRKKTIVFHGFISDIKPILLISHCIIHPSNYPEGMANILLEAAASGRPIITTNRSGCKEAVTNNQTGFIFDFNNKNNLVSLIDKFLTIDHHERVRMGILGRKKMENEFDRKLIVSHYISELIRIGHK